MRSWVSHGSCDRAPQLEDRVKTQGRSELPELFRLIDGVAGALRVPSVDQVVVVPEFNAAYGRYGWRQRRVLFLGLPLLLSLDAQERVALIGHELGHGANGDQRRSLFVVGALSALIELWAALEPDALLPTEEGLIAYIQLPFRLIQLGLARLVLTFAAVLLMLLYRDSQRAEYYADALGARASGRRATLAMLERLHAAYLVARMTWVGETADPVAAVVEKVRRLPDRQRERLRRVERLEGSRLDYTHPPTVYRVEALESRPEDSAAYVLGLGASDAVDRELERFRRPIGEKIVDDYLSAVSY